ncbi:hypothetical protein IFM89_031210 [Coptis chinensis]|uniref:Uncharacterized protein n=1 Tax=Coptis chinensis TaxID=261450 RepID=A0A835ITJ3_9MAGN|nr:hypothetical protein IFM89_031210 [Coptis chinensis]
MEMMFEFYEDGEVSMESCSTNSIEDYDYDQVDDEKSPDSSSVEERKVFCEAQQEVLHGCRKCLMSDISDGLCKAGYNSAICKSKWISSSDIPSGEHIYIDVVDKNTKKGEVRVVIELNFQAEFEMARASKEYNQLVDRLPEVFVGKAERLRTLIKIMCSAAKTCTREKKMHMGPWSKHKKNLPRLDEEYVMSLKLARIVLIRLISPDEFANRRHLRSFWLLPSKGYDVSSSVVNEDLKDETSLKGLCWSSLNCSGLVTYLGGNSEKSHPGVSSLPSRIKEEEYVNT